MLGAPPSPAPPPPAPQVGGHSTQGEAGTNGIYSSGEGGLQRSAAGPQDTPEPPLLFVRHTAADGLPAALVDAHGRFLKQLQVCIWRDKAQSMWVQSATHSCSVDCMCCGGVARRPHHHSPGSVGSARWRSTPQSSGLDPPLKRRTRRQAAAAAAMAAGAAAAMSAAGAVAAAAAAKTNTAAIAAHTSTPVLGRGASPRVPHCAPLAAGCHGHVRARPS